MLRCVNKSSAFSQARELSGELIVFVGQLGGGRGMVPEARLQMGPLRVLVIEDEVLLRTALAEELRAAGLTVVEAISADEAWSYLEAGGRADLVFSDVNLPGSMDGVEFARRVRKYHPDLHVVLTSGTFALTAQGEGGKFLPKPYAFDDVVNIVLKTLDLKRGNAC